MNENLEKMGLKKSKKLKDKIMTFIAPSLVIRHIKTRIEYTVEKLNIRNGKPVIIVYRYSNKKKGKTRIEIPLKDFKQYEPV